MTGGMWQMRPLSRGYVKAKSADPRMAPAINPRYLSEETDRRAAIGGLPAARRLFHAAPRAPYFINRRGTATKEARVDISGWAGPAPRLRIVTAAPTALIDRCPAVCRARG